MSAPESITLRELIDAYMAAYAGRDTTRPYRLTAWVARLGDRQVASLTDDDVFHALKAIAAEPARVYHGRDVDGRAIHRAKGPRSTATINRYRMALQSVLAWAIRQRCVPKGWENPCRKIEREPEHNKVVRFLDDQERERLLAACRGSRWPKLYVLVLLALTTGARRGELQALAWGDVDLERAVVFVRTSKNGEPRVLPLTPAALEELRRFQSSRRAALVFGSKRRPDVAFKMDSAWAAALSRAGVRDFRFHDCRHDCASQLARAGASLIEIADVLGHRTMQMVARYSHLSTASKTALVNRVLGGIK